MFYHAKTKDRYELSQDALQMLKFLKISMVQTVIKNPLVESNETLTVLFSFHFKS
jgi:hypothetical protein